MCVTTDVVGLVETAEHADLRELGHAGEQHELQMFVGEFEHAVESLENLAVVFLQGLDVSFGLGRGYVQVHHVEQRFVVFVNQHDDTPARLFMGLLEYV